MGLVSGLIIASTALSAGGQIASGIGARKYASAVEREGARLGRDAVARGEKDVERYAIDLAGLLGAQRTSVAAQGIDVNQGTAAAIRSETEAFGAEDIQTIRENALREAYGLRHGAKVQAQSLRWQAAGQFGSAFGTLLSGGADAWGVYQRGKGAKVAFGSTLPSVSYGSGYGPPSP